MNNVSGINVGECCWRYLCRWGRERNISLLCSRAERTESYLMVRWIVIVLLNIGVMSAAGILTGCAYSGHGDDEKGQSMPERTIEQVQEEHTNAWMAIPGVEGTAIGLFEGKPCIKIFTSTKPQEVRAKIPSTVEGYPVIIEETGTFRALDNP